MIKESIFYISFAVVLILEGEAIGVNRVSHFVFVVLYTIMIIASRMWMRKADRDLLNCDHPLENRTGSVLNHDLRITKHTCGKCGRTYMREWDQ